MSRLLVRSLFHAVGALHHFLALWCLTGMAAASVGLEHHRAIANGVQYGARYLTIWNFTFQTIFLTLSLWCDWVEWSRLKPTVIQSRVRYYRDVMYHALVFPFTLYVTSIFWILFSLDRELVYPRVLEIVVPVWCNHSMHSSILLVLVLESILLPRGSPDHNHRNLLLAVVNIYSLVYYYTYFIDGVWLYPIHELMSWSQVVLWQLKYWLCFYVAFEVQSPILRALHGTVDGKHYDVKNTESPSTGVLNDDNRRNNKID